jgi:2-dehydropantoate 2-reductase
LWCGGWGLNPRRPTPPGPQPGPFGQARAPPLSGVVLLCVRGLMFYLGGCVLSCGLCIVGGGSIGGSLAYYAFRGGAGRIIVYYGSQGSVEAVRNIGGLRILIGGEEYFVPVEAYHYLSPAGHCRFIINAVKAYSVPATIPLMRRLLCPNSVVLMVQNGFGSCEEASWELGGSRVACAATYIGAQRLNPNTIRIHGGNTIIAGGLNGPIENLGELAEIFRRGGLDFRITRNIQLHRWVKLAVNAVINPLTGIARAPNKIILNPEAKPLIKQIITETVEAAAKKKIKLDPERLIKTVIRAAANTPENYSSMAQDIINKRKTEIDYINGYIARINGNKGINQTLTQLIHLIESTYK